jgi:hypothetical protein
MMRPTLDSWACEKPTCSGVAPALSLWESSTTTRVFKHMFEGLGAAGLSLTRLQLHEEDLGLDYSKPSGTGQGGQWFPVMKLRRRKWQETEQEPRVFFVLGWGKKRPGLQQYDLCYSELGRRRVYSSTLFSASSSRNFFHVSFQNKEEG